MLVIFQSILWAVFGAILYREKVIDTDLPKLLGRTLYWFGVPLQIFFLARQSNFNGVTFLPSAVMVLVFFMGLILALLVLKVLKQLIFAVIAKLTPQNQFEGWLLSVGLATPLSGRKFIYETIPANDRGTGSFILASILGNTGFIGLALVPALVDRNYWSWIVLYGVAHNIIGSYGLGVLIADRYSRTKSNNAWFSQIQNLFFLPSLWAFAYGYLSRDLPIPRFIEFIISQGVLFIVPGAFILIGMQLSQLQQWQNLRLGIFPTILKMLVIPGLAGMLFTFLGMEGDSRLVLVLMSGMPTAFATIVLAEEYDLDRQIAASSILLSTLILPPTILLWLTVF